MCFTEWSFNYKSDMDDLVLTTAVYLKNKLLAIQERNIKLSARNQMKSIYIFQRALVLSCSNRQKQNGS